MKITIFRKLLLGFGTMLLLTGFIGGVGLYNLSNVGKRTGRALNVYFDLHGHLEQIESGMEEARRNEKDFLLKGEGKYAGQVKEHIEEIKEGCRELSSLGFVGRTLEIAAFADEYYKGFLYVVGRMEEKARLLNVLRKESAGLEDALGEANDRRLDAGMHMMRRHEEDFLLYNDVNAIGQMRDTITLLKADLERAGVSGRLRVEMGRRMDGYWATFSRIVVLTAGIERLRGVYGDAARTIDGMVGKMGTKGEQHAVETLQETHRYVFGQAGRTILLLLLTSLGIGMIAAFFLSREFSQPVKGLTGAAMKVAGGNLDQRVHVDTRDEVGELGRAFNRMVEDLKRSREQIEEYSRTLEQRVEERTKELVMANKDVEDFTYIVSHDLKSPLVNIQGFSKRLESLCNKTVEGLKEICQEMDHESPMGEKLRGLTGEIEGKVPQSFEFIFKGVKRMADMIEQLLQLSRLSTMPIPKTNVDLPRLIHEILGTMGFQIEDRKIEVKIGQLPVICCEESRIKQVFANLLSNAIKYIGEDNSNPEVEVGYRNNGNHHLFFVRDNGIGIDEKDYEKIFRIFTRLGESQAEGHGMGLAFVKKIIQGHGGRIWIESEKGKGSTFYFTVSKHLKETT